MGNREFHRIIIFNAFNQIDKTDTIFNNNSFEFIRDFNYEFANQLLLF